ncbi:MAG: hypothetical protein WC528_01930 [Patescibacteria group bacterium]
MKKAHVLFIILLMSANAGCGSVFQQLATPVYSVSAETRAQDIRQQYAEPWFPVEFQNWATEPVFAQFEFRVLRYFDPNQANPFLYRTAWYRIEVGPGKKVRVDLPANTQYNARIGFLLIPGGGGKTFDTNRGMENILLPRIVDITPYGAERLNRSFAHPLTYQATRVTFINKWGVPIRLSWLEKNGSPRNVVNKWEDDNGMRYESKLVYDVVPREVIVPPNRACPYDFLPGQYSVSGNVNGRNSGGYEFVVTGNGRLYGRDGRDLIPEIFLTNPGMRKSVDAVKIPSGFDQK